MEDQVIIFDGIEYKVSELSEDAMRYVSLLNDLNDKIYKSGLEFEQLQAAKGVFIGELRGLLKSE